MCLCVCVRKREGDKWKPQVENNKEKKNKTWVLKKYKWSQMDLTPLLYKGSQPVYQPKENTREADVKKINALFPKQQSMVYT